MPVHLVAWPKSSHREYGQESQNIIICQETRHKLPSATLHPWDWPQKPWQRVHTDYAGPFLGRMFLILVDANTKWVDIHGSQF